MKDDDIKNEELKALNENMLYSAPLFGVVACALADSKNEKEFVALLEHRLDKLQSEIDLMKTSLDYVRCGGTFA